VQVNYFLRRREAFFAAFFAGFRFAGFRFAAFLAALRFAGFRFAAFFAAFFAGRFAALRFAGLRAVFLFAGMIVYCYKSNKSTALFSPQRASIEKIIAYVYYP